MQAPLIIELGMAPIVLASVFYLLMLRPWRLRRMIARRVPSVDLLFLAGVALAGLALLEPLPFDRAAVALTETTTLPGSLAEIDQRIAEIETLPERMWADLTARLGWGAADASEVEPVIPGDGPVAGAVLPAVHGIVSGLMRAFVWAGSLAILVIAQLMRGIAGLRQREPAPERLRRFDRLIDDRVASLEDALQTERRGASPVAPNS